MKKTIRLMGLCLLIVACIVFAACANKEVQEGHTLFVTHFGNGELDSSSYEVNTLSIDVASEEGNTITVEADGLTYVHTLNEEKTAVTKTVCSDENGEVYTATYDGTSCSVAYADGKTLSVTFKNNGKLESVSDGTTTITYAYLTDGVTRTDTVKKDGAATVTHTVKLTDGVWRRTATDTNDYTISYAYTDNDNWTETTTFKSTGIELITTFANGVKTTSTQKFGGYDIVNTYAANGDLLTSKKVVDGTEVDAIAENFTFEKVGNSYKVTGYTGNDAALEIPAEYSLLPVTEIGAEAFKNNAAITSVSVPTTVKKIGANAFSGAGIVAEGGVYYAGNWVVGVEAGTTAVTLDKNIVGIADSALSVEKIAITYNGTQNEWIKVIKGANWYGAGYTLNLNPGKKIDGYMAKDEYVWTTGEIVLKNRGEYAVTDSIERLLYILKPYGVTEEEDTEGTADLRFAQTFEAGVRYDKDYVYLAIKHRGELTTEFHITLNPNASTAGQVDVYGKVNTSGFVTGPVVTAYTSATETSDVTATYLVDKATGYVDNGMENVNTIEIKLSRAALESYAGGEFETLGFIAHMVKHVTIDGETTLQGEMVYGDGNATIKPYKSLIETADAPEIGYHVLSLREDEPRLSLVTGWLLADYGFKQGTFNIGEQLERTAAPVVDGAIYEDEYTWSTSLAKNPENFFYIDKNGYNNQDGSVGAYGIPEGEQKFELSLAHDKNYIYAAVVAYGVHDVDSITFRIGNTEATGKAWNVTVKRDILNADYKEALAEGNVNHNTITVVTTEQTAEHARGYQEQSSAYNPAVIVVGRAMTVDTTANTITLEIAFDRAALERDADNPDLDQLYLHVSRNMSKYNDNTDASKGGKPYGEIHFGFRVEEGDTRYDETENVGYDNAMHRYHQSIFNRFPHVITFTAPVAPAEQVATGSFQVGYGIANITPWLDDMGLKEGGALLTQLNKDKNRDLPYALFSWDRTYHVPVVATNASSDNKTYSNRKSLSLTLAGYMGADKRFSTSVSEEIFATCIAFRDEDGDMALLVSLDVLHFTTEEPIALYDNVMRLLRPLGFEEGDVIISATHTHTSVNIFSADAANRFAYLPYFYEQIYNAAEAAVNDLKTVEAISTNYYDTADTENGGYGQLSFERRGYDADGFWANTVSNTNGISQGSDAYFESDYVYNGEKLGRDNKTADSDIQMVRIDRAGQDKPIVIANWSAHPDNVPKNDTVASGLKIVYNQPISGDFIYYMRDAVDDDYNFAFFQGASGNTIILSKINTSGNLAYGAYGTTLGGELVKGLNSMTDRSTDNLSVITNANEFGVYYESSQVGMPERVSDAIDLVNDFYDGMYTLAEAEAKLTELNAAREAEGLSTFSSIYECQSLRHRYSVIKDAAHEFDFVAITIGDVTFASAPYEMFWQTGWDIRNAESISDKTILVLTHANGTYGYIPTQEIIDSREGVNGGYEVSVCNYQKGSAERIAEHMIEMIEQNYGIN